MGAGPSVEAILAGAKNTLEHAQKEFPSTTVGKPAPHEYSKAPYSMVGAAKAKVGKVGSDIDEIKQEASDTGKGINWRLKQQQALQ